MKSFRKCIAILLAVSFAAPVDGGPLRERLRVNRARRETRARVSPEMEKSIARGAETTSEPAPAQAGEITAFGGVGGGTINPGPGTGGASGSLSDLSNVSDTLTGDTGDILSFDGTDWDDQTLEEVFTQGIGNGTDGYVLTTDGAGVIAWEAAAGGSGLTVTGTPVYGETVGYNDFDDTWEPVKPGAGVLRVKAYGASGRGDISTTGTVSGASAALTLASASTFAKGQGIAVVGAGATHGLSVPGAPITGVASGTAGATHYTYAISAGAADGGYTEVSTETTELLGNATLSAANYVYVCWQAVANAKYYLITGRSETQADRSVINRVPSAPNAKIITFQAGGYTPCDPADVGRLVTGPGSSDGRLAGFDNTNRLWWVVPTIFGTDTFASFGSVTMATGVGAGTSTAVANGYAWKDTGDASSLGGTVSAGAQSGQTNQPNFARRPSSEYYPGDIIQHPLSTSGVYYLCVGVNVGGSSGTYPRTSATTTASWSPDSTIGNITSDGDVQWMAVRLPIPVDEPTAAVPNMLRTTISSISGTSVTMADVSGNAVTASTVLHDDYPAIDAALSAAAAANPASTTIYFDPGYYIAIFGDQTTDTWSQWETLNSQDRVWDLGTQITWDLSQEANVWMMPLTHPSAASDTGLVTSIFRTLSSTDWTYRGGNTLLVCGAEPKFIQDDGWNQLHFVSDATSDSGASQRSVKNSIRDAGIWGFGRVLSATSSAGIGGGWVVSGNQFSWGGSGHDALYFGEIGQFSSNVCFGHAAFGSDVLYTPDEATDTINDMVQIRDNKIRRSRTNGMRLRCSNCTVSGNHWIDSFGDVILCDTVFQGVIADNYATNGGRFQLTGSATFSGNQLYNVQLSIAGGNVAVSGGVLTWDNSTESYFSGGAAPLPVSGGTRVTVSGLNLKNTESSGSAGDRGVQISGGTDVVFDGVFVDVASEKALDVTSAFSGTLTWNGGTIDTNGSVGINLIQNASAIVTMSGTTIRSNGGGDIEANNGTLMLKGVTSYINFDDTTGLDFLSIDGCEINKGVSGTTAIACPNTSITNTTFGSNPSMTGLVASSLSIGGNRITTSRAQTLTALAANTDNLLVGVCDTLNLTTSGTASYNLTGLLGLQEGNQVTLVNAESSGADVITLVHASTSTAGNQFFLAGAANYAMDPGDWITVQVITAGGATYYREVTRGP